MHKDVSLFIIALVLFVIGVSAILFPVLMTKMELNQDAEEYDILRALSKISSTEDSPMGDKLDDMVTLIQPTAAMSGPTANPASTPGEGKTGANLTVCKAANEDFIAWIQIPGTTVDYPVVLTDDIDYYLNHTFEGKKSYLGTLFSLEKTDYHTPTKNITVYGHHIRSNKAIMFSPLIFYKDKNFYSVHENIFFDTFYHTGTYKIFAAINMHNGDWEPSVVDFASDKDFLNFVSRARQQALYDTGVEVKASDQILTLITCDRDFGGKDGRLVVMAVKQ